MVKPCFPGDQPGDHLDEPAPHTVGEATADLAVPVSAGLDVPVEALPATSNYAMWARGELSIEDLLPQTRSDWALATETAR
jgi:hypothetical protein